MECFQRRTWIWFLNFDFVHAVDVGVCINDTIGLGYSVHDASTASIAHEKGRESVKNACG